MPQPIRKPCEVVLSGFANLPEHAQQLGHIVSLSGFLESLLGHLLAYLTSTSAAVTIPMFHAVSSTDAQRSMLMAAAEQILVGSDLDEFRDLMEEFRTRYGERSRLVHNLWGTSPEHPGKAVWCASKDSTRLSSTLASMTDPSQIQLFNREQGGLWRCCSLWTPKDMKDVFDRLAAYTERVRLFVMKLIEEHPAHAGAAPSDAQAIEPPPETPRDQIQG